MTSHDETFNGRCICGAVRYSIKLSETEAQGQVLCHCNYCKRMTGSVFSNSTLAQKSNFSILSGEPRVYDKDSAPPTKFHFCGNCGTQIYSTTEVKPGAIIIRIGTLDRQAEFNTPTMQINCENESPLIRNALEKREGRFDGFPPM